MHCMVLVASQRTQMLKGLLDPCLLAVIDGAETYGYEILSRLAAAGLADVAEGSVYPALTRLERAGYLQSRRQPGADGPPRKYYALTPLGRTSLAAWQRDWAELSASISSVLSGGASTSSIESSNRHICRAPEVALVQETP